MTSPEQIQRNIERTREHLSTDVDRLSEKVSPSEVVNRRVNRLKGSVAGVREKVMGAMPDSTSLPAVSSSLQSATETVTDAGREAPQMARRQAQGSPLAAGLIAFGIGALVSSLLPPSQAEQAMAARAQDKASDLAEPVKEKAQQVAGQLQESAQGSLQEVKQTATDAVTETADQAKSRAQDVTDPLKS